MTRTGAALGPVLVLAAVAAAHPIHRPVGGGHPIVHRPIVAPLQPAGVIPPPTVPYVGSGGTPSPSPPAVRFALPFVAPGPFFGPWGYSGGYGYWAWPDAYDVEPALPLSGRTPQLGTPVYVVPPATSVVRSLPAESPAPTRARLTLNLPPNARVWLAGKAVDTAINPVVLESPDLEPDQRYTFDIRVTWSDSRGEQERQRTVTVGVGQSTSLTYNAVGGPPGQ